MDTLEAAVAVISAAIGSFFGAYGAQWIVESQGERRRNIEELRSTNTATALASLTLNGVLDVRRQHLSRLIKDYKTATQEFNSPTPGGVVRFRADFEDISLPHMPVERLMEILLHSISLSTRAITIGNMAHSAFAHLERTLSQRNTFVDEVRQLGEIPGAQKAALYFGLTLPDGRTDARYPSYIKAIEMYVGDTALFLSLLVDELSSHGTLLHNRFPKRLQRKGSTLPKPSKPNLSVAFEEGSIPDPKEYADLLKRLGYDPSTVLNNIGRPG